MNFDYLDNELTAKANAANPGTPTDVFRLPNGDTVQLIRGTGREGARIVLSSPAGTMSWSYASEFEADAALAAWEPDLTPGPGGWFSSSELSSKPAA